MFLFEYSRRKRLDRVAVEDFNRPLHHDRAVVEVFVDEVHRATCYLDAVIERLPLCVDAGEPRQQRRMDVEDSILKRAHKKRAEKSHIPGQTYQQNVASPQFGYDLAVVLFSRSTFVTDHHRLNAMLPSFHQPGGRLYIADDYSSFGIEAAFADRVEHSDHVRS